MLCKWCGKILVRRCGEMTKPYIVTQELGSARGNRRRATGAVQSVEYRLDETGDQPGLLETGALQGAERRLLQPEQGALQ